MSIVIEKIEFKNFRQYGTGTIRFTCEDDCKLSILVAKNGTGKTTLLNSITWCLYEKEQQLIDKKSALSVVSTAELETAAESEIIPVYVAVTIQDGNQVIEFKRSQSFKKNFDKNGNSTGIASASTFTVSTTVDGRFENTLVEDGADAEIKVKKYFDPAIYDYYFFDGEQLREFFAPEKTARIKGSIFNIAQVTLLQTAFDHVEKMRNEKMRTMGKNSPDIADLVESQSALINQKNLALQTIETSKQAKDKAEAKLDQIDEVLRGYAPVKKLQEERTFLESKLKKYDSEKKEIANNRADFIRKYIVLLKLYPRIKKTLQIIQVKEAAGDLPPVIDRNQIKLVLENLDKPCPLCDNPHIGETGRQHLENLLTQISVSSKTSNYLKEIKSSLEYYLEETEKYQSRKNTLLQSELDLEEQVKTAEDRLKVINSSLANFTNSDGAVNVAEAEKKRSQLRDQISSADKAIGTSEANIKTYDQQIAVLQKQIDDAQKKLGIKNSLKQQIAVLVKIEDYFRTIKNHITTNMRKEIQTMTWNIFASMIWKRNTFGKIIIGDSYDISVYNKEGALMTGSLSATEQMALAYAFTLAIHQASGKNCPLVIDSPLGRVSDDNRENMAKALLEVSKEKQIIMLFTPDEYSDSVKNMYESIANVRELKLSADEKYVEGIES